VWQTLSAKEQLCEELDRAVQAGGDADGAPTAAEAILERWAKLPEMSGPWEKQMTGRRDGATHALTDSGAAAKYVAAIERNAPVRREILLELELLLGQESPAAFQAQRLALQVKQLKERFSSAVTVSADNASLRLLAWCALPGVADGGDRQRIERILARVSGAKVGEARGRN
jgi:hypothetical protein